MINPDFPARLLGQEHIDQYVKSMIKGELSPHTINLRIRTIRTFWSWALKKYNWLAPMEFPQVPAPLKYQYFTDDEFDMIITKTPSGFLKEVFNLYRDTGARKSEIGKFGRIEGLFYILSGQYSKTKVDRVIPILPQHIPVIKEMQSLPYSPNYYSRKFKEACRAARVQGHLHLCRHTFALRKWLETGDIYLVSRLLGHSSVSTTEIYMRHDLKKLQQDFPTITNYKGY